MKKLPPFRLIDLCGMLEQAFAPHYSKEEIRQILRAALQIIIMKIGEGFRVRLPGIGEFYHMKAAKKWFNAPYSKDPSAQYMLPPAYRPRFRFYQSTVLELSARLGMLMLKEEKKE